MAKNRRSSFPQIQGITNYSKLRNNQRNTQGANFHKFNPFMSQQFSDEIKKNHEGESVDQKYLDEEIYAQLLAMNGQMSNLRRTGQKASFFNLSPKHKRTSLIQLSAHDQIDEVLTKLTDELIVTSQNEGALQLDIDRNYLEGLGIKKSVIDKLEKKAEEAFHWIHNLFGFDAEGTESSLWNKTYLFLTEGAQAYEIVYDNLDRPTKIIGILEIDALELEEFYVDGIKYWKHHKKLSRQDEYIVLYDSQVVMINWADASPNNRFSYIEQLVRSFNNVRIMDESLLIWTVTNSTFRMLFKVPTRGKSRIQAAQTLVAERARFKDEINYDSDTGELRVNGGPAQQFSKEYWMGEGDSGSPSIETVGADGPDMNNTETNEYYNKKFYRNARMPFSRFDSNSSETWNLDTRSQLREEISFGRFCDRIRSILKMLVLRPLYLQLALEMPEIKGDLKLLKGINIRFNTYSVFEELMRLDILREKVEVIESLKEAFTIQTPEGDDKKFFATKFLVQEYLPELTEEKLKLNKKYVLEEQEEAFEYQREVNRLSEESQRIIDRNAAEAAADFSVDSASDEEGLSL